jgi:hypothetical protein
MLMSNMSSLIARVVLGAMILAGCGKSPAPKPAAGAGVSPPSVDQPPAGADSPLARLHQGAAVSDEEALALGRRIEMSVAAGDASAFAAEFDWGAFRDLVLADMSADTKQAASFKRGVSRGLDNSAPKLATQMLSNMEGGSYELLGVRQRADGKRLLLRVLMADGRLNYHELCLARRGGRVCVVDLYNYTSGERMSESLERTVIAAMPPENLGLIGRLRGADKQALADMKTMQQMAAGVQSGQSAQALADYGRLPKHLQAMKMVQLLRILAAQGVDDTQYLAAIEEYQRLFPGDPSVELISIDGHILRKEWQAAHDALDRLDQAVGGDPYLQVLHGNTYVLEGDHEQALQRAKTMLAASPRDENAHWLLVSVSLARRDDAETARLLTILRDELKVAIGDLTQLPDYADFVRSPEYDAWKRSILK